MKKKLSLIILILTVSLLCLPLAACDSDNPEKNESQATPTYIDNVRYDFNSLYDDLFITLTLLDSSGYDYEADSLGIVPVRVEILDIAQIMPTMDDYVTVAAMYAIEKRVQAVSASYYAIREAVSALSSQTSVTQ